MRGPHWTGPPCPQDEGHGRLLDWPNGFAAFYCPSSRHVGMRFLTTDLAPASRSVETPPLPAVSVPLPSGRVSTVQAARAVPSTAGRP